MKVKVNIVDDHKIVADGLRMILSEEDKIEIQDIAHTGEVALAQLVDRQPDIVLMDYSLNGGNGSLNGLQTAEKIIDAYPNTKVMMLTMHQSADYIVPCVSAGVHGYMLKSERNSDIGAAILHLYQHGQYFSPEVAKDLAFSIRRQNAEKVLISEREQEVLEALFKGANTKEIAEALFISHHTVETHRKNLIQKFGAKNSVHLIYLALQEGVISV